MTCSKEIVGRITNKLQDYLLAVEFVNLSTEYQVLVCVPLKYCRMNRQIAGSLASFFFQQPKLKPFEENKSYFFLSLLLTVVPDFIH